MCSTRTRAAASRSKPGGKSRAAPPVPEPSSTARASHAAAPAAKGRRVEGGEGAWRGRRSSKAAFRSIDTCESGRINDYMLERYVRKYLVKGRERYEASGTRRQDLVLEIVAQAIASRSAELMARSSTAGRQLDPVPAAAACDDNTGDESTSCPAAAAAAAAAA